MKTSRVGYLYLLPYIILFSTGADVLITGRTLDDMSLALSETIERPMLATWVIRFSTIFILVASVMQIHQGFIKEKNIMGRFPSLTSVFLLFWLGSVGLTMALAKHPYFSHDYFYTLIIGLGVLAFDKHTAQRFCLALRNSIVLFSFCGLILIPVLPNLVLELDYSQGLIEGLPRFAGLAPHAVMQGYLALLGILLFVVFPMKSKLQNISSILMLFFVLFLAQSKTTWLSLFVCGVFLVWHFFQTRNLKNANGVCLQESPFVKIFGAFSTLLLVLIAFIFYFFGFYDSIFGALGSPEGEQITSLTGRDVIWEVALTEWQDSPIFGYGARFLDLDHRLSYGMPFATHAHNQFMDVLARSGLIGVATLIIYIATLFVFSKKSAYLTKGISMAIFITLMLRAVSEVPLLLFGYSLEMLAQFLIFAIIISGIQSSKNEIV